MVGFTTNTIADIVFQEENRMTACYAEFLRTSEAPELLRKFHGVRIPVSPPPPRSLLMAEAELLHIGLDKDDVRKIVSRWIDTAIEAAELYLQAILAGSIYGNTDSGFPTVQQDSGHYLGFRQLSFERKSLLD